MPAPTPARDHPRITVAAVQSAVGRFYGLTRDELLSRRRYRAFSTPRQIAMYLAKHLTLQSYPNLGRRFGDRDHTTVLHAVRKVAALRETNAWIAGDIDALALGLTAAVAASEIPNAGCPREVGP